MSYWVAGAAVGSAVIGASSSNNASKAQQGAAGSATDIARGQYTDTVERNQPFLQAGTDDLAQLQQRLPSLTQAYDPNQLTTTPGYQFGLQQGQQALERSLAARGRSVSGAALKAASQFGTDYATTKLDDADSRQRADNGQITSQLMGLANLGQSSANQTAQAGQNFSTSAQNNTFAAGNSAAANDIAQGNQLQSLINQGISAYKPTPTSTPSGMTIDTNGMGMGQSTGADGSTFRASQLYADGGPVRVEPKVGTRSPLPGGGGGGLSRDAIMSALNDAHARAQATPPQPSTSSMFGVGTSNPRIDAEIQYAETHADGGPIRGPGGPRTDSIPARLSDGEHVFDAESVTALGDGDNEKGQALLNEMRMRIKAHNAGKTRAH